MISDDSFINDLRSILSQKSPREVAALWGKIIRLQGAGVKVGDMNLLPNDYVTQMKRRLDVLAAYQPYATEIEWKHDITEDNETFVQKQSRGVLIGVTRDSLEEFEWDREKAHISLFAERSKWEHVKPVNLKLVLRSFDSLCPGAPNKALPCTDALRSLLEYAYGGGIHGVEYAFKETADASNRTNRIYLQFLNDDAERLDASFWSDGTALVANSNEQCLDYLRSQHYAMPVMGRHLEENVDYILKA